MLKLIWYLISINIIFIILINNPSSQTTNSLTNQNKFFTFRSNQLLIEKFILISIIIFIIFTAILSTYT